MFSVVEDDRSASESCEKQSGAEQGGSQLQVSSPTLSGVNFSGYRVRPAGALDDTRWIAGTVVAFALYPLAVTLVALGKLAARVAPRKAAHIDGHRSANRKIYARLARGALAAPQAVVLRVQETAREVRRIRVAIRSGEDPFIPSERQVRSAAGPNVGARTRVSPKEAISIEKTLGGRERGTGKGAPSSHVADRQTLETFSGSRQWRTDIPSTPVFGVGGGARHTPTGTDLHRLSESRSLVKGESVAEGRQL